MPVPAERDRDLGVRGRSVTPITCKRADSRGNRSSRLMAHNQVGVVRVLLAQVFERARYRSPSVQFMFDFSVEAELCSHHFEENNGRCANVSGALAWSLKHEPQ